MSQTTQQKNKALVLEAFDTLFNRRDYATAERYWSPRYIQHRRTLSHRPRRPLQPRPDPPANLEVRARRYRGGRRLRHRPWPFFRVRPPVNWIAADIIRIDDGILVEHWDVIQDEATEEQSKSKAPMFGTSFPSYATLEKTIG